MPLPIIHRLCDALDRLCWSGLQAGARDDELTTLAEALEAIAVQVPSASQLAAALRRCTTLPAMEAAPTLLKLAVAARRLRAQELGLPTVASTTAASTATPLPVPREGPPHHALPPLLLAEVRAALRRRTAPTQQVLAALAEPATAGEVRLWPLVDRGLDNPFLRATLVELAIRIGPPMAEPLQRRFNRRGGEADAARLTALAGILGKRLQPLLKSCILKGSAPVELAALEALGRHDPGALPGQLCERFDRAPPERRQTLLPLLASIATEAAARDRLLAHVVAGHPLPPEAFARLPEDPLPDWLDRLSREAPGIARSAAFIELLESRPVPSVRAWLREACHAPDAPLRRQAAEALLAIREPEDLRFLAGRGVQDEALALIGITALISLGEAEAFEVLAPRMTAWSAANPPDIAELPAWLSLLLSILGTRSDRRWVQLLSPLAAQGRIPFIRALASLGGPAAVEPLAQAALAGGASARHAVHALGELGLPEALPPLLTLLQAPGPSEHLEVLLGALAAVGDARAVPALEALRASPGLPEAQRPFVDAVLQAVRNRERKSP